MPRPLHSPQPTWATKPDWFWVSALRWPVLCVVGISLLVTFIDFMHMYPKDWGSDEYVLGIRGLRPVLYILIFANPFYLYYSHKGLCQLTAGQTWFWTTLRLMWNSVTGGYYGAWYYRTGTDRKNILVADHGHENWDEVAHQLGKEGIDTGVVPI